MNTDAHHKNVAVTGATRGCGRAMAEEFIRLGHRVAGCGRSATRIHELNTQYGPAYHFHAVDVADDVAVAQWAGEVIRSLGAPDLLINNAAVINANAPLWTVSARDFDQVIDVNLKGVANVIRHFVPAMIARGSGVIVNISSGWGRSTNAEVAPYCCTKWGIEGLSQAMAQELPGPLAVVALNPGIINTDMLQSCFGKGGASSYPTPAQWAKYAVPYLLSLGRPHNGQSLSVG